MDNSFELWIFFMQTRKETTKLPHSTSDRYLFGSSTQSQYEHDLPLLLLVYRPHSMNICTPMKHHIVSQLCCESLLTRAW